MRVALAGLRRLLFSPLNFYYSGNAACKHKVMEWGQLAPIKVRTLEHILSS